MKNEDISTYSIEARKLIQDSRLKLYDAVWLREATKVPLLKEEPSILLSQLFKP